MKIDFNAIQMISAVDTAPNINNHDTALRSSDGVYYGRISLMADLLQEVVEQRWVPSGKYAMRDGIKLVPEKFTFDLSNWTQDVEQVVEEIHCMLEDEEYSSEQEQAYYKQRIEELQPYKCGFSACAVGHACYDSRFNEAGLTITTDGSPATETPTGYVDSSWTAVHRFFGIEDDVAEWLFMETRYPIELRNNPAAVRERCIELVTKGHSAISNMLNSETCVPDEE